MNQNDHTGDFDSNHKFISPSKDGTIEESYASLTPQNNILKDVTIGEGGSPENTDKLPPIHSHRQMRNMDTTPMTAANLDVMSPPLNAVKPV